MALILLLAACSSPPSQVAEPAAETAISDEPAATEPAITEPVPEKPVSTEPVAEPAATESNPAAEPASPSAATEKGIVDTSRYDDFEIITLLPQDAIPAIDNPTFHTAAEADEFYEPDELVMGVVFNGDARAYSVPHLSSHEIVNDEVGGVKISVTW